VVPRLWLDLVPAEEGWPLRDVWGDTGLVLPQGLREWRNVLTGERCAASGAKQPMREVLATFPVAVLEAA
jgi:maltooligosyltrehalose synthase